MPFKSPSSSASIEPTATYPRIKKFCRHMAMISVVNIICALIVTYMLRVGGSFSGNLVFSFCIGSITMTLIDGTRLLIWGEGAPWRPGFFALLAVSIPTGYLLGNALASWLLGLQTRNVVNANVNGAPGLFVMMIVVTIFVSWFFWNRGNMAQLTMEAAQEKARASAIEKQAVQAQLKMLQAQIEPHMLFNTLANLQSLIEVDPPRAQHMLDQLIHYLRATLASSRASTTTLAHEFALMNAYLELMSVRMGKRLTYTLGLPDALRDMRIAPMLLQPLVENAIKHGLEPKLDGGRIDVVAREEGGMLELRVVDTGLGLDTSTPENPGHGSRIGVANVRERLHGLYGTSSSFSLTPNAPTGVIARLSIPLSYQNTPSPIY